MAAPHKLDDPLVRAKILEVSGRGLSTREASSIAGVDRQSWADWMAYGETCKELEGRPADQRTTTELRELLGRLGWSAAVKGTGRRGSARKVDLVAKVEGLAKRYLGFIADLDMAGAARKNSLLDTVERIGVGGNRVVVDLDPDTGEVRRRALRRTRKVSSYKIEVVKVMVDGEEREEEVQTPTGVQVIEEELELAPNLAACIFLLQASHPDEYGRRKLLDHGDVDSLEDKARRLASTAAEMMKTIPGPPDE
jgi:hypothetical protein